jgi:hypothetical protein
MSIRDRLKEAFAKLDGRLDSAEDGALDRQSSSPAVLDAELAQARSMLDVVATRLSALPQAERPELESKLGRLRQRWGDAQQALDAAKATGGERRSEHERDSRAALDEVQDGLLALVSEMNTRFAGHPLHQ